MRFHSTPLDGAIIIDLEPASDERGFFARTFCSREFSNHGLVSSFVQSNTAVSSKKATLRGIHYQTHPFEEVKVVRCIAGAIFDVIVDLRPNSSTFAHWYGVKLDVAKRRMIYVPEGFGHGYVTLEDNTEVLYNVSQFYTPAHERIVRWNDPLFAIRWPLEPLVISSKDANQPDFEA